MPAGKPPRRSRAAANVAAAARKVLARRKAQNPQNQNQKRTPRVGSAFAPPQQVRVRSANPTIVLSSETANAFWNSANFRSAPALQTTLGNFTTVNSIVRFTVTTFANLPLQLRFYHSSSCLRAEWCSDALTTNAQIYVAQQQQLDATNTVPLDLRPLRMSVNMINITQALNVAGNVVSALVPQSLQQEIFNSSVASTQYTAATWTSMWNLVQNNPQAIVYGGKMLTKQHTFVMPPSSFVKYNTYGEFVPLNTQVAGSTLTLANFQALAGLGGITPLFPYSIPNNSVWPQGQIPSNYILMLNIQPNALPQTYELEVHCQDGVRYPANSMAAAVAQTPVNGHLTDGHVQQIANKAAQHFGKPTDKVSRTNMDKSDSSTLATIESTAMQGIRIAESAAELTAKYGSVIGT